MNWIALAHQSVLRRPARSDWRSWRAAADVKKIDPTKNTRASTVEPTHSTNPGNGPTKKHAEPMANSTPIHHPARRGAHQAPTYGATGANGWISSSPSCTTPQLASGTSFHAP